MLNVLPCVAVALLCVLAADPAGVPGTPEPQAADAPGISRNWIRLKSPHFIAEGTSSPRTLQRWLDDLETFRDCLRLMFPNLNLTSPVPNRIVVMDGRDAMLTVAPLRDGRPDTRIGGYFMPRPDVNFFVVGVEGEPQHTIFHEYTHFVLHNGLNGPSPSWVEEGLAEFYGTFSIDRDRRRAVLGRLSGRWGFLSSGVMLPVAKMITEEGAAELRKDELDAQHFYAQSWALVHYLNVGHKGKRDGQLNRYLLATTSGVPSVKAFQDAFQTSPVAMQNELRSYLNQLTLPGLTIDIPERPREAPAVERMFEWETHLLRGRLLTSLGRLDEADKMLAQARLAAAVDSGVRQAVADLRRQQGRLEDALEILEPLLVHSPGSFGARLLHAQTLTDVGRHDAAVVEYEQAAALNARVPVLWLGLSVSQAALGRDSAAAASVARLRQIDADPRWLRSRARMAWTFCLFESSLDDAIRFTAADGFASEEGSHAAFQGVLAGRRLPEAASRIKILLDGLAAAIKPRTWPSNVLAFLQGSIDAKTLIGRARGNGELTQAHAYAGLMALAAGAEREALAYMRWVAERGSENYVEYGLVRDEMKRQGLPLPVRK